MASKAELIADAKRAGELGDHDLELAILKKADSQIDPTEGMSVYDRFMAGVGKGVVDTGRGVGQLARSVLPNSMADSIGLPTKQDIDYSRQLDEPLMNTGSGMAGDIAGNVASFALPGAAAMKYGGMIPKVGGIVQKAGELAVMPKGIKNSAISGALMSLLQTTGEKDSALKQMLMGGAIGGVLPVVGAGVGKGVEAVKKLTPTNSAIEQMKKIFGEVGLPSQSPINPGQFYGVDVNPTLAMLSDSPELLKLEQNARLRNAGGQFSQRDSQNIAAVYEALNSKAIPDMEAHSMQDALNASTSGLRDGAINLANNNPELSKPLIDFVASKMVEPGIRNSSATTVLNKALKSLSPDDVQGLDLYTLKKELSDSLHLNTLAPDELTNSIKNNRRLTAELLSQIDSTLSNSSGGKWDQYLSQYKEGMVPINEGRAVQNILDKFETAKKLYGTDIPAISPSSLRKAVESETYKNLGKSAHVSKVSDETRKILDSAVNAMNKMEQVRTGAIATNGSPSATFLQGLIDGSAPSLVGRFGTAGALFDLLNKAGIKSGSSVLDDAILNPGKLQDLLDIYAAQQGDKPFLHSLTEGKAFIPSMGINSYSSQKN